MEDSFQDTPCSVCGSTTKTGLHYGAVTCYPCRAFFRRLPERKRTPRCKKAGQCPVDAAATSNKLCGGCRFNKCLREGMQLNQVLNEEQRKDRFAASFRRKRAHSDSGTTGDGEEEGPMNLTAHFETPQRQNNQNVSPIQSQHPERNIQDQVEVISSSSTATREQSPSHDLMIPKTEIKEEDPPIFSGARPYTTSSFAPTRVPRFIQDQSTPPQSQLHQDYLPRQMYPTNPPQDYLRYSNPPRHTPNNPFQTPFPFVPTCYSKYIRVHPPHYSTGNMRQLPKPPAPSQPHFPTVQTAPPTQFLPHTQVCSKVYHPTQPFGPLQTTVIPPKTTNNMTFPDPTNAVIGSHQDTYLISQNINPLPSASQPYVKPSPTFCDQARPSVIMSAKSLVCKKYNFLKNAKTISASEVSNIFHDAAADDIIMKYVHKKFRSKQESIVIEPLPLDDERNSEEPSEEEGALVKGSADILDISTLIHKIDAKTIEDIESFCVKYLIEEPPNMDVQKNQFFRAWHDINLGDSVMQHYIEFSRGNQGVEWQATWMINFGKQLW